jgi:hypothetical protein
MRNLNSFDSTLCTDLFGYRELGCTFSPVTSKWNQFRIPFATVFPPDSCAIVCCVCRNCSTNMTIVIDHPSVSCMTQGNPRAQSELVGCMFEHLQRAPAVSPTQSVGLINKYICNLKAYMKLHCKKLLPGKLVKRQTWSLFHSCHKSCNCHILT